MMNTSVSALVRDALNQIAGSETEFERMQAEERVLRERLATRELGFRARTRLTREESHERDALR